LRYLLDLCKIGSMIHAALSSERPQTTHEWLVSSLREAIIRGGCAPGEALRQDEIARSFGVSRMPLREALRTLSAEGWVDLVANRGAYVAALDATDAVELFDARAALEAVAARHSVRSLSDRQLERVEQAHYALHKVQGAAYFEVHRNFHLALYAAASSRLQRTVALHIDASRRYIAYEARALDVKGEDRFEHEQMLSGALARDGDAVAALMSQHIAQAGRDIAARLRQGTKGTSEELK